MHDRSLQAPATAPRCPVTGAPASRFVQWVGAGFLAGLWKLQFRADARPSFGTVERFGLWESPTGLYFFDPAIKGDDAFYKAVYSYVQKRNLWPEGSRRREFVEAARRVQAGDRVLDVGCGFGAFRHSVLHARYTGLDPHFASHNDAGDVRNELLRDHLTGNAAATTWFAPSRLSSTCASPFRSSQRWFRRRAPAAW